jgi:hypothetical protein
MIDDSIEDGRVESEASLATCPDDFAESMLKYVVAVSVFMSIKNDIAKFTTSSKRDPGLRRRGRSLVFFLQQVVQRPYFRLPVLRRRN